MIFSNYKLTEVKGAGPVRLATFAPLGGGNAGSIPPEMLVQIPIQDGTEALAELCVGREYTISIGLAEKP